MNAQEYIDLTFSKTQNKSLLGHKMTSLADTAIKILEQEIPGEIAECGVYQGGSARLLATIFPQKKILLFDSFSGMLENDTLQDGHRKGDFKDTSLDEVKSYLSDMSNCLFFPGWLPESANFLQEERFCLVHLDLDLYQSTRSAIEIFWPKITNGGVMVFDDWEWRHCPGVKRSIQEYFDDQGLQHTKDIIGNVCAIYKTP